MKKIAFVGGGLLAVYCLVLLFQVFAGTDLFLRETIASVSEGNIAVDICPITTNDIPINCPLGTNQEAAISSLRKARKQLPLSHPESQRTFFLRIHSATDSGSSIYCIIVHQYKGQEELLFLARIEREVNCNEGKFKYQSGSLAIDNFLMRSRNP